MKQTLLLTTLILLLGMPGYSQNTFFEAYKLNQAYKLGDYKGFFQLLANQPGLSQKLGIKKGEAIEYATVYSHYSSTSFLKIALDSMRNTQNHELKKLNDTVATLQVRKTELVSSLNVLLDAEINDYLIRVDSLERFKRDLIESQITDPQAFGQMKMAVEAVLLKHIIIDTTSSSFRLIAGLDMDKFDPVEEFFIPSLNDLRFSQVQDAILQFLENQQTELTAAAAQIADVQQKVGVLAQPVGGFEVLGNRGLDEVLHFTSDSLLKIQMTELEELNALLIDAVIAKRQKEKEKQQGLTRFNTATENLNDPNDGVPLYYTPSVIKRQPPPTIIVSGAGSSFESSLIDATAGFIAERMKEELNVAFFEKFIMVLEKPAMQSLFPTTRELLNATESYNYSVMLDLIKSSFEKDLRNLPFNAPQLMRQYPSSVVNSQEAAYILLSGQVLSKAVRGDHPSNIISYLGSNDDELLPPAFHQTFAFLNIVSNSLRDTVGGRGVWIGKDLIGQLSKDAGLRQLYIGLLHRELYDFAATSNIIASPATLSMLNDGNRFYGLVSEFAGMVRGIEDQLFYIKNRSRSEGQLSFQDLLPFYRTLLKMIDFSISAYAGGAPDQEFQDFLAINNSIMDIYTATAHKNYSLALVGTLDLLRIGLGDDLKEKTDILRYGSFMVALAKAENAQQIKSVIQSMALPVGSYGIKRRNFFNIALNAYPGFTNGAELAFSEDSSRMAYNVGFTAPIGFSFSWGYSGTIFKKGQMPGDKKIQLKQYEIDPNQHWKPIAKPDTNLVFEKINDSVGIRKRVISTTYSTFTELETRIDSFNSTSDQFIGSKNTLAFLRDHPRIIKRQSKIRRATKFRGRGGEKKYLNGTSGSIFVSVVDLGAAVLFRLDSSTDPLPSDVTFRQIFAPGIFYTHGFRDIPISLLAGAQLSPQLRKFGDDRASALRFNIALTVDIPMFNFYTKTEK